jgi:hypothetical protein
VACPDQGQLRLDCSLELPEAAQGIRLSY